jgi:hypothetical protein
LFSVCSHAILRPADWEANMDRPFDRQAWMVVAFGWAVALWVTLT